MRKKTNRVKKKKKKRRDRIGVDDADDEPTRERQEKELDLLFGPGLGGTKSETSVPA